MSEYKLVYKGTFAISEVDDACVITLTDDGGIRALTIIAERPVAMELKNHEQKLEETQDHFVDVMGDVINNDSLVSYRIVFRGIKERGFFAQLVNVVTGKERKLRNDEAVLFAVASGIEMYATLDVFQHFSTPFNKEVMSVAIPILSLPNSLLKKALDKAIQEENYEGASFIRDEMKRREEKNQKAE